MKEAIEKNDVVVAGDGRHDSMGHSAKYCAYTLFNCTSPNIIHFSLVQVCNKIFIILLYIKDMLEFFYFFLTNLQCFEF
jgi:hypothetical protein